MAATALHAGSRRRARSRDRRQCRFDGRDPDPQPHLRDRPQEPGHGLDRGRDRLRRAQGPARRRATSTSRSGSARSTRRRRWVLERSGAAKPDFMNHVMLRVSDVMREEFPVAHDSEPVREVGLMMARGNLDIVPIVDDEDKLLGVMTERALAHRYIRESRKTSTLVDAPTTVEAIVRVLDGDPRRRRRAPDRGPRLGPLDRPGPQREPDLRRRRRHRRRPAPTRSGRRSSSAPRCSSPRTASSPPRRSSSSPPSAAAASSSARSTPTSRAA